jgi:mono/diheme cytochrome c family protein
MGRHLTEWWTIITPIVAVILLVLADSLKRKGAGRSAPNGRQQGWEVPMQIRFILSLVMLLSAITVASAQDVGDVPIGEVGDPQAGFDYAHATCAACHAIAEEKSPNPRRRDSRMSLTPQA